MPQHLTGDARAEFLSDARDLIDWLIARPEVPLHRYSNLSVLVYDSWVEDNPEYGPDGEVVSRPQRHFTPAKVARAMGKADKHAGYNFSLERPFGAHRYTFYMDRDSVCEPKVVGERQVTEKVPTDEEKIAQLQAQIDALHEEVTRTEPVVEYDCPKSLLADAA